MTATGIFSEPLQALENVLLDCTTFTDEVPGETVVEWSRSIYWEAKEDDANDDVMSRPFAIIANGNYATLDLGVEGTLCSLRSSGLLNLVLVRDAKAGVMKESALDFLNWAGAVAGYIIDNNGQTTTAQLGGVTGTIGFTSITMEGDIDRTELRRRDQTVDDVWMVQFDLAYE